MKEKNQKGFTPPHFSVLIGGLPNRKSFKKIMQQKITKKNGAGFNSIGAVLPDRIKQYKLQKAFYKHQAIRFWQDAAQGFAEELGRETRAIDLKNGILIVACLSKELAYQIRILAARIIEQINQLIGKQVVYAISVEV